MRLIDADALLEELEKYFSEYWHYTGVNAFIGAAPTVDAVPVVRCKDCEHCFIYTKWNGKEYCGCRFYGDICEVLPTHFCSYGERKMRGNENRCIENEALLVGG